MNEPKGSTRRVMQHGFVVMLPDGRQTRFIVFANEDDPERVPCFICGDTCLTLTRTDDAVTWDVEKPLHPTADDQQHCADCCPGCTIDTKRGVVL